MWVSREMDEKKNVKICFAASSGGHYEQLMMLKPLMEKYDSFIITEKTDYSAEQKGEKTYYMKDADTYLSIAYGDYMKLPPEDQRINHGIKAWRELPNEK